MANFSPKAGIIAGRVQGGFDIPINHGIEAASQTYPAGAPLIFSSGSLVVSTAPVDATNQTVGFSIAKATGTTGADAPYVVATGEQLFEGWLLATSGSDSTNTHTLAQSDVGVTYGMQVDAISGLWYVNFSDTSNKCCFVVQLVDAIGTVGRVLFKVIGAATPY